MNRDEQLGTWGVTGLIVSIIITKMLISAPSLYAKQSASAGWLEVLISGIFELLILSIVLKLTLKFDGLDLIDIAEHAFGKTGKFITGMCSCIIIVISTAAVFRCFGELIRNTVIRGISYENIFIFLLAACIIGAYLGLRAQLNLNGLIVPIVLFSLCAIFFINALHYSVSNILPIFGTGLTNVISNALLKNASFFEIGIVLFLVPYLGKKSNVKKISFTALGVSVLLASIISLAYQLAVPYEAAGTFALPIYQMTRMIKAGTFFQRIEPLNVFIWSGTIFIYVGIGIWLSAHIFKKTFSLTTSKPLVFIFAQIVCLLALIPGSETSVERIYDFLMTYSYLAYPLAPLTLLILSVARSKAKEV